MESSLSSTLPRSSCVLKFLFKPMKRDFYYTSVQCTRKNMTQWMIHSCLKNARTRSHERRRHHRSSNPTSNEKGDVRLWIPSSPPISFVNRDHHHPRLWISSSQANISGLLSKSEKVIDTRKHGTMMEVMQTTRLFEKNSFFFACTLFP